MQAGFLCLEAGSTRSKNRINVIIKNLSNLGLSVLVFWAVGYGLMFGSSWHGFVGVDRFVPNFGENKDIWTGSFFLFQAMFCSTAVTILSGATAERLQFKGYLAIVMLVSGVIYPVFGHWIWQGADRAVHSGWLAQQGFIDFAGTTVVHSVGGWCSLAAVLVVGSRIGRFSRKRSFDGIANTDLSIAFLGTMLLWFGWFGFNGGSNLVFNATVSSVIANTLMGGAAGIVTPIFWMIFRQRPVEVKPMLNGAIAGLVAVTGGCHAFSSATALLVGAVGSLLMMAATVLLERWQIDDVVGAIPVHLAAGLWGTLSVGLFGNLERLSTGLDRIAQIKAQLSGILVCGLWTFIIMLLGLSVLDRLGYLRVSAREEYLGLNIIEHGARSQVDDLFRVMSQHAKTGNLKQLAKSDPFTEVGRVGHWYNQVIAALESAIATNEAIVSTALDSILTVDKSHLKIQSANPAATKTFGYRNCEIVGKSLQELLLTTKSACMDAVCLARLANDAKPFSGYGRHSSGQSFPIELTAAAVDTENGSFFTVFIKDVSARRLAEDALLNSRAQERAKAAALEHAMAQLRRTQAQLIHRERIAGQGQLVAGIAHEVNNPANFIHGNLDCAKSYVEDLLFVLEQYRLQSDGLSSEVRSQLQNTLEDIDIDYIASDYAQMFASMKAGTERIRTIVKQLRSFSRYDESEFKTVDLHSGIDSTLVMVAHRLEATAHRPAIQINCKYGKLPAIDCYASSLNRALLNIITNAIDAFDRAANEASFQGTKNCPQSPQITIKTRFHQERIFVAISNNGPAISENNLKQIFDPFFTTQPVGKGTGLGCTISYQIIVEQHHGQLSCVSRSDTGVCFFLELPAQQPAAEQVTSLPSASLSSASLPSASLSSENNQLSNQLSLEPTTLLPQVSSPT